MSAAASTLVLCCTSSSVCTAQGTNTTLRGPITPAGGPPPVAPAIGMTLTTSQQTNASPQQTGNDHKGPAEDVVDAGKYVVKCYVYTYVVLPCKIVKGVAKAVL